MLITRRFRWLVMGLLCGSLLPASVHSATAQDVFKTVLTYQTGVLSDVLLVDLHFDNGILGRFVLDTGTSVNMISEQLASRLNLTSHTVNDAHGHPVEFEPGVPSRFVTLAFKLGELPITDENTLVVPANRLKFSRIDGIVGLSTLSSMALLLDCSQHRITVMYPGDLDAKEFPGLGMSGATIAPITNVNKACYTVKVRLNHQLDAEVIIDTGSNATFLSNQTVRQLGLKPTGKDTVLTFYGPINADKTPIPILSISDLNWVRSV